MKILPRKDANRGNINPTNSFKIIICPIQLPKLSVFKLRNLIHSAQDIVLQPFQNLKLVKLKIYMRPSLPEENHFWIIKTEINHQRLLKKYFKYIFLLKIIFHRYIFFIFCISYPISAVFSYIQIPFGPKYEISWIYGSLVVSLWAVFSLT